MSSWPLGAASDCSYNQEGDEEHAWFGESAANTRPTTPDFFHRSSWSPPLNQLSPAFHSLFPFASHPAPFPSYQPPAPFGYGASRRSSRSSSLSSSTSSTNHPAPQSAVGEATTLSQELMDVANKTLANYDIVHAKHFPLPPEEPSPNPFLPFAAEELEDYYVAAVDAKNALQLRTSAVKADIGDSLELLLPKLSLHQQDSAVLKTLISELGLIRGACSQGGIAMNFYGLEHRRYLLPRHRQSVLESHSTLFSAVGRSLRQKAASQRAAQKFMEDPLALQERRLPAFQTSQR